jgi:hypothetical protein
MTWRWRAEGLQRQQRPQGATGWDHVRTGEAAACQDRVQVGGDQVGQEEEQAAELGMNGARRQVELTNIGQIGRDGAGSVGSLVVAAARQLGETLFLQDRGDGRRTECLAITAESAADVVDGEVLFAEGDDLLPQPFLLPPGPAVARGRAEEVAVGAGAELIDEDAETSWRVAEAGRCLGR